jgi:hypothetical protein
VQAGRLVALGYRHISTGFSGCTADNTICATRARILPDGNRVGFVVLSGIVLVITDIHWTASGDDGGQFGDRVRGDINGRKASNR